MSLIESGLRLDTLHEFPFSSWRALPFMERRSDGWWQLPDEFPQLPLMFSVKASKPPTLGHE